MIPRSIQRTTGNIAIIGVAALGDHAEKLDFGDKSVLIEKGRNIYLAAVLHGKPSKKVTSRMKAVVDEIEEQYDMYLIDWDGDLDKVRGVSEVMKKLYSRAPAFPGGLK